MKKPRRKLKNLKINEISFVDRPAVEGALARLIKSEDCTLFYKTHAELEAAPTVIKTAPAAVVEKDEAMPETFEVAVAKLQQERGLSGTQALSAARSQFPELFAKYQISETPRVELVTKSETVVAFEKRIDETQTLFKCSRIEALRKAARTFPDELEAYRSALC